LQCQADILGLPVLQAPISEATALGAAYLAGLRSGVWSSEKQLCGLGSEPRRFEPRLPSAERERRLRLWHRAVQAVIAFYSEESNHGLHG
jgi:glycerol kinase